MIYEIAGVKFNLSPHYPYTAKILNDFICGDQNCKFDFSVCIDKQALNDELPNPDHVDDHMLGHIETTHICRAISLLLPNFDKFLVHANALVIDDNCYLFIAPSGGGKSTHSALWQLFNPNCRILNGDKPIIGYDQDGFTVYGSPWKGKEGLGYNCCAKLRTVCLIIKSQNVKLQRLSPQQAVSVFLRQVFMPTHPIMAEKTLDFVNALVSKVPIFALYCDISKQSYDLAFKSLTI